MEQQQQQQQQEAPSPPASDDARPRPERRRRRLRRRRPMSAGAAGLLLLALGSGSTGLSSSQRWIGAVADAAVPISAAAAAAAASNRGRPTAAAGPFAFVGAPAGSRGAWVGRRSEAGPLTVRWDTEQGSGERSTAARGGGGSGRFKPFKAGALASLVRPTAVAAPPAPASSDPLPFQPAPATGAFGAGLQQIWDALQGNTNGSGGGSNTVFKVLLATVACVYGTNFGAIKYLDEANVDVSIVTAIRFFLASLSLGPFLFGAPKHILIRGLEVGIWVAFGYLTQAIGLQDTQASKSAFICSLSVVVVPIVNAIVYKKKPPPITWLASILAVIGVGMLTLEGDLTPSVGDLWSLGQPLGFGVAFVRTEQCMSQNKDQALAMTAAQMLGVFMCAFVWVSFTLTSRTPDLTTLTEPANIAALFYTGVITSAFAVVAESVALAHVSAEETTVILSTEPLWAALFGAAVLGEKLTGIGYLGGLVILGGCILTQAKLPAPIMSRLETVFGPGDGDVEEGEE